MLTQGPDSRPSVDNKKVKQVGVQYEMNPGAEYGNHIANTTATCNSSISHTYGNVISLVEKYLLEEIFTDWNFRTVTVGTTLISRQVRHVPRQLRKKEMPVVALLPRISFGQEDNRFLGHTLINDQLTRTHALWGDGSLIPLAKDSRKRLYVHGHYQRAVLYIDVVMAFDTFTEQCNAMSTLYNMASINHPQDILAPLELYIPPEFCKLIGNLSGNPIDKDVSKFLGYMNTIWDNPITYKLKGGNNENEFFMYYLTDILTLIQDPQPGPGIKDGQIKRGFDINFTIRCDFNTVGYFTLNHPDLGRQIDVSQPNDNSEAIIPMFSDSINLNDFPLPMGWSVFSWPIFKLSSGENSISIDSILNKSLRAVIDYHLKMHIPMDQFIRVQFRENGEVLSNEAFYIDWARRTLFLTHPNYRRTYRLIVTVSAEYVNELIQKIYNLE